ncbi:MAG: amino acid permease C-terminal domain-containing protein [bacterium]
MVHSSDHAANTPRCKTTFSRIENWIRLGLWLLIGFAVYFGYGRRQRVMARYLSQEVTKHGISPGVHS